MITPHAFQRFAVLSGRTAIAVIAATLMLAAAYSAVVQTRASAPAPSAEQSAALTQTQRAIGTRVTFVVTQVPGLTGRSSDQITIVFSDRPGNAWKLPPSPIFGDDIVQEFSFSARDFDSRNSLTFSRLVRDQSFLLARYIRVINHGGQGWGGGTLSMTVDGQPILNNVSMQSRKGDAKKGLQDWNRERWNDKSYWEMILPRTRKY
jgi:hypothetical protein